MSSSDQSTAAAAIVGSLLGTAVGDALGLPYEGLSPRRGQRLYGPPGSYHLLLGRGMISDDTEHACLVAQALIAAGNDVELFARQLARRLRAWFLMAPAGIGLATLRACLKLCVGVSPDRSGMFSAGNGSAMRAPLLGAAIDDRDLLLKFVRASTRITHTDPKAEQGALAVALATRWSSRRQPFDAREFTAELRQCLQQASLGNPSGDELISLIERAAVSSTANEETPEFAASLGLVHGVTGYMFHTVPVALHAWMRHPQDLRSALLATIRCGGDTDTTAAIVGGIIGSSIGRSGIPSEWLSQMWEWPRTAAWMEHLATAWQPPESARHEASRPACQSPALPSET